MKKKIVFISILLLLILSLYINKVQAVIAVIPAEFNISNRVENNEDGTISVIISVGDIVNDDFEYLIQNGEITSGTGEAGVLLKYAEAHFSNIEVVGLNGWTAEFYEEEKAIELYIEEPVMPNTDLVEIIFTPIAEAENKIEGVINANADIIVDYDGIVDGEEGRIAFSDQTTTSANYTINATVVEEPIPEVNTVEPENVIENSNRLEEPKDNTVVPDKELPQTGVDIAITVAIIGLIVVSIIGFIKYRKTNIK